MLTTRPYIRTVSDVKAEWYRILFFVFFFLHFRGHQFFFRLIELAANYFDLNSFPEGETKKALKLAWNKRAGKEMHWKSGDGSAGAATGKRKNEKERELKRRKKMDGRD